MPADQKNARRYMVLQAEEVRNGLSGVKPGWLMGRFVGPEDLRFSAEFEVKEWDLRSMRRDWRDGSDCGPEYIAVLSGVLTVRLGRIGGDGTSVEVDDEIELSAEQRIILAPGVWRSFRASDDVKAITVRHCARG